jgi:hypothetical protein
VPATIKEAPRLLFRQNNPVGQPSLSNPTTDIYLTADVGVWIGLETPITREWQWFKDGNAISGQTGRVYQLVSGDINASITFKTRVQNAYGWSAWATSNAVVPVA